MCEFNRNSCAIEAETDKAEAPSFEHAGEKSSKTQTPSTREAPSTNLHFSWRRVLGIWSFLSSSRQIAIPE
jgi:hypothetical protein